MPQSAVSPAGDPGASAGRVVLDVVLLVALWALLFLPNHGVTEMQHEEGRRVLPAREMLSSGDFVLPRIWGHPYLAKPPAQFWAIAAAGTVAGEVTPSTARIPSLLATLATALLVYGVGLRLLSRGAGWIGAVGHFLTPIVFEKGTLAEIEALFGFLLFAAVLLLWHAVRRRNLAWIPSGVVLGLATLTKGPAAWVFFLAAPLLLGILEPRERGAWLRATAGAFGVGLVVAGTWVALLLRSMPWEELRDEWTYQVAGAGVLGWGPYLEARYKFVLRTLGGFSPGLLVMILALAPAGRRAWLRQDPLRIAAAVVVGSLAFFLFYPRAVSRYVFPLVPWIALFAAEVLLRAVRGDGGRSARAALRVVAGLAVALAFGLAVASAGHPWWGEALRFELDAVGGAIAAAGILMAAVTLRAWRRDERLGLLVSACALFVLARAYHMTQIVPSRATEERKAEIARSLEEVLEPGRVVRSSHWNSFNTLSYVDRPIRYERDPDPATFRPGETLLVDERAFVASGLDAAVGAGWEVLLETPPVDHGFRLLVLRRTAGP